jgi:hypothetical protein
VASNGIIERAGLDWLLIGISHLTGISSVWEDLRQVQMDEIIINHSFQVKILLLFSS